MTGTHQAGDLDRDTLIDEQLTQCCALSSLPVRVKPAGFLYDRLHLASAARRGIANPVSDLVRKPKGNELRIQAKAAGFGVGDAGEMFETDERNTLTAYYELAGICSADSHHQHDVDVTVDLEKVAALIFRISGKSDDIHSLEHRAKVGPSSKSR